MTTVKQASMEKYFLILSFLYVQIGVAQTIKQLDGKWHLLVCEPQFSK
jgi:hypothetical protein